MKYKKNYMVEINIPKNVEIITKNENLIISGVLGSTLLNLFKLDAGGQGCFKIMQGTSHLSTLHAPSVSGLDKSLDKNLGCDFGTKDLCFTRNSVLSFSSNNKSFFKCISKLIKDKIAGVSNGVLLYMRVIGVGYKIEIKSETLSNEVVHTETQLQTIALLSCVETSTNQVLYLKIGFSHDFKYTVPSSVKIFLLEPTLICIYGVDKQQVTQIAAKLRHIKTPSVYKGKGFRLANEIILLKQGKRK